MPYKGGRRLAGESASKLGHLDVIKSELVNDLIEQFEDPEPNQTDTDASWEEFKVLSDPLRLVFAVDGSLQTVRSDIPPYKELSFVKTALLRLDRYALDKLDHDAPHPLALRDVMAESAMYHATVFPLKGIRVKHLNNYEAVRRIIFDSFRDNSLGGEPFETLKWIAYEKWADIKRKSPSFECPECQKDVRGLLYDADTGVCEHCGEDLYLSDMIGFHLEMSEDAAPQSLASAYMLVHETLLLFTGIRYFWERKKFNVLANALFIKDGPLTLRGQYSKLVIPIRNFFDFAQKKGISIHVTGQEKTGAFVDHLQTISRYARASSVFLPSNDYIRREIQHRPKRSEPYGARTNYGNKLFVKIDDYHHLVISVPTGQYRDSRSLEDLVGIEQVLGTLPSLISHRHECALLPVELANGVASLSSYPSAAVLKIFADI